MNFLMLPRFSMFVLLAVFPVRGWVQDFSFRKPLEKEVLGESFPKAGLVFRGENRRETGPDYEDWEQDVAGNVGIIRKFVREELNHPDRMDEARLSSYLNRYAAAHPLELFLLHFNSRAKLFDFHADKFWVGHYLQQQGVQCQEAIDRDQTVIAVPGTNRFKVQKPFPGQPARIEDSVLLLVERDQEGVFHWENHEFVFLVNVNADDKTLTVRRGAHHTGPASFKAGQCYVTQIKQYRDRLVFNLSLDCPRSPNGQQAADVLLELFDSWFCQGGPLEPMDGIAFDVQYWDIASNFDTNVDGIADGGIILGQPRWAQGVYRFSKSIREHFGDDFIITSDGHRKANSQAIGIHNGIESEGLVQHNDGWRGISRTVNTHQYWNTFNTSAINFNYIVTKLVDRQDAKAATRLHRFAHAMAACLGVGCTDAIEDVIKGTEQEHFWLGKAVGPMVNLAETSDQVVYRMPDVLGDDDLGRWSSADDVLISRSSDGGLRIGRRKGSSAELDSERADRASKADGYAALPSLSFEMTLDLPPGDLFVTLDVRSESAREGFSGTEVPRLMTFDLAGHYDDPQVGPRGLDIWTLAGQRDYFASEFYVRNAGGDEGRDNVRMRFEIDGPGDLYLKNLVVRNASVFYAREFEHGVVVVNPSLQPRAINLIEHFGEHDYAAIRSSDPRDSVNNGLAIANPAALKVEPVSGLFISKQ